MWPRKKNRDGYKNGETVTDRNGGRDKYLDKRRETDTHTDKIRAIDKISETDKFRDRDKIRDRDEIRAET